MTAAAQDAPLRDETGGDSACWAHLLCPECSAVLDADDDVCPRCGVPCDGEG